MSAHPILWTSPTPLWGRFLAGSALNFRTADQARPAILRFASDDFMEQLLALLDADPRRLGEVIARPETWRNPGGAAPDLIERVPLPRLARALARARAAQPAPAPLPATTNETTAVENGVQRTLQLKLYHPAHQRYYLVGATLVCGIPGFPDRAIASGGREQIGFVLRRLMKPAANSNAATEYAFVKDAQDARWQRVTTAASADNAGLVPGEELLPLFPLNFSDDTSHPRRMFAGLVPVGRRDEYMTTRKDTQAPSSVTTAAAASTGPPMTVVSERKEQFKFEVAEPWKNLIRSAHAALHALNEAVDGEKLSASEKADAAKKTNERLQAQSWLVLLDFADYLALHVPAVWAALLNPSQILAPGTAARRLYDWIAAADTPLTGTQSWQISGTFAPSLLEALKQVRTDAVRRGLERTVTSYPDAPESTTTGESLAWPPFRYLLIGILKSGTAYSAVGKHQLLGQSPYSNVTVPAIETDPLVPSSTSPTALRLQQIEQQAAMLDRLVQIVIAAIDATQPAQPAPQLPFAVTLRDALETTKDDDGWFVLRCVYVRCDCGPLHPVVLSAASQQFQLASFFDPDAPARPIRIGLPLDTTPAGMRKFNKNTALLVSDVLCGQMQRAKGLGLIDLIRAVLPWPLHKDLDVGGVSTCKNAGGGIGMICSLSIPIVTICALILLMIIVTLLDLIFRWLPYIIMCFPVPGGLKAKKAT